MPEAVFREEEEGKEEEEEVEVGECIKLRARDIRRIKGWWYYVVSAFGIENVMFSLEEDPQPVGVYDEENNDIIELGFFVDLFADDG